MNDDKNNLKDKLHSRVILDMKEDIESLIKMFNDKFNEIGRTFKMTANVDSQNYLESN